MNVNGRIERLEKKMEETHPTGYTLADWRAGRPHPDASQQAVMDGRRQQAARTLALFGAINEPERPS
jgi:hypothetical protein